MANQKDIDGIYISSGSWKTGSAWVVANSASVEDTRDWKEANAKYIITSSKVSFKEDLRGGESLEVTGSIWIVGTDSGDGTLYNKFIAYPDNAPMITLNSSSI